MSLIFNATKKFQDSVVLTSPSHSGKYPQNTRDALYIHKANNSGIFQIEKNGTRKLYDRCYAFTDINYINQNKYEKILKERRSKNIRCKTHITSYTDSKKQFI